MFYWGGCKSGGFVGVFCFFCLDSGLKKLSFSYEMLTYYIIFMLNVTVLYKSVCAYFISKLFHFRFQSQVE